MTNTDSKAASVPPFVLSPRFQVVCKIGHTLLMVQRRENSSMVTFVLGNDQQRVSLHPKLTSGQDVDISEDWQPLFQSDDFLVQISQRKGAPSVELQINTNNIHDPADLPWWGSSEHKTLWLIDPAKLMHSEPGEQSKAARLGIDDNGPATGVDAGTVSNGVKAAMDSIAQVRASEPYGWKARGERGESVLSQAIKASGNVPGGVKEAAERMAKMASNMASGIKSTRPDWLTSTMPTALPTDVMGDVRMIDSWKSKLSRSADYTITNHIMNTLANVIPELAGRSNETTHALSDIVAEVRKIGEVVDVLQRRQARMEGWQTDTEELIGLVDESIDDLEAFQIRTEERMKESDEWAENVGGVLEHYDTWNHQVSDALGLVEDNFTSLSDWTESHVARDNEHTTVTSMILDAFGIQTHADLEGIAAQLGVNLSDNLPSPAEPEDGERSGEIEPIPGEDDSQYLRTFTATTEDGWTVEGQFDIRDMEPVLVPVESHTDRMNELEGMINSIGRAASKRMTDLDERFRSVVKRSQDMHNASNIRMERLERRLNHTDKQGDRLEGIITRIQRAVFPLPTIGSIVRHRKSGLVGEVMGTSSSNHSFVVRVSEHPGGGGDDIKNADPMDWQVITPAVRPVEDAPEPLIKPEWLTVQGVKSIQMDVEPDAGVGWWEGKWICQSCGANVVMDGREQIDVTGTVPAILAHCPACNNREAMFQRPVPIEPTEQEMGFNQ